MAAKRISFDNDRVKTLAKTVQKADYFQKTNFATADKNTAPEQKDSREYMLPWVRNIYGLFLKKRTWMGQGYDDIDIMRSYMEGNQPVDQYRDFLYGKAEANTSRSIDPQGYDVRSATSTQVADRMAWVNIDEKPLSIGPKIVTKLLEQARGVYYEIGVNAVDSMSVQSQEMAKARLWFEKENAQWMNAQRAMLGITQQEPEFMPLNVNELEMFANSGGFKVPYAVNMEILLKHTFDISEWDKEVAEKVLKDAWSIRYAMVREYFDHEDMRVKVKYVDPKYGGLQFSRDYSFKDSEYGYELEEWPISRVRQKFDLTHEQAAALAYSYGGEYGNPVVSQWNSYGYYDEATGSLGFDFYRVPVFRCEWIDVDNERYYKHVTENGRVFNKPVKDKDISDKEVFNNPIRYVREATWIPGTEYLTDYGKMKYIPRDNPKKPRISYRGVRLGIPALFQQIRPLLNGLTLAWWKTQQAIGIAISNGIAVDVGALKNIVIGKDKSWDVTEVLKYYRQQAILLHKKGNPMNFQGGGGSPVTPLVTRMHENIQAQFEIMDRFMGSIEAISGVNLVSTGETPDPRVGKYNMQVALQGTSQIIGAVIRAATELQADVAVNAMCRIRSLCRNNKPIADSYANVIGKEKMHVILQAEKDNVQYGINIEARDISEMKAFIEQILATSIKMGGEGSAGLLDASEVIMIRDMMEQKQNMRMISMTLGYILRKKGKERELEKMKAIELQGEQLRKVEQEKQQYIQGDRMFELAKLQKEFEYDFYLKYGYSPTDAMNRAAGTMPQAQQQGMPQASMPAQQPQAQPQINNM